MSFTFQMVDPQRQILEEIADKRLKQADVALTYAFGLRQSSEMDWPTVNHAIIERWSVSGLQRIKKAAWKHVQGDA